MPGKRSSDSTAKLPAKLPSYILDLIANLSPNTFQQLSPAALPADAQVEALRDSMQHIKSQARLQVRCLTARQREVLMLLCQGLKPR